jgi:hypothetical protein
VAAPTFAGTPAAPVENPRVTTVPVPAEAQPAAPRPSEPRSAELDQLDDDIDQLSTKTAAVNGSLDRLQEAQARQGLGLRRDMAAHQQSMNMNLAKAREAADRGDASRAKRYYDLARTDLEALEEFLGR